MIVTNNCNRVVHVTDSKGEVYHVPPKARNVSLPTVNDVSELPKELVKVS